MRFRLLLTFTILVVSISSWAQDTTPVTPEDAPVAVADGPINIITQEEILYTPLEFRVSDGGQNWTPADLENFNKRRSFNKWFSCFRNPSPECQACEEDFPSNIVAIRGLVINECLPAPTDNQVVFYKDLLPDQKKKRDDRICSCYMKEKKATPIENYSFEQGIRSRESRGRIWEAERFYEQDEAHARIVSRLTTERFATGFSVGSNFNNPQDALGAASRYSSRGQGHNEGGSNKTSRGSHEHNRVTDRAIDASEREELTRELFYGPHLPHGFCFPYRNVLAS